jgi:hypothetical protein
MAQFHSKNWNKGPYTVNAVKEAKFRRHSPRETIDQQVTNTLLRSREPSSDRYSPCEQYWHQSVKYFNAVKEPSSDGTRPRECIVRKVQ